MTFPFAEQQQEAHQQGAARPGDQALHLASRKRLQGRAGLCLTLAPGPAAQPPVTVTNQQ